MPHSHEQEIAAVRTFCDAFIGSFDRIVGDNSSINATDLAVSFFHGAKFVCQTEQRLNSDELALTIQLL